MLGSQDHSSLSTSPPPWSLAKTLPSVAAQQWLLLGSWSTPPEVQSRRLPLAKKVQKCHPVESLEMERSGPPPRALHEVQERLPSGKVPTWWTNASGERQARAETALGAGRMACEVSIKTRDANLLQPQVTIWSGPSELSPSLKRMASSEAIWLCTTR